MLFHSFGYYSSERFAKLDHTSFFLLWGTYRAAFNSLEAALRHLLLRGSPSKSVGNVRWCKIVQAELRWLLRTAHLIVYRWLKSMYIRKERHFRIQSLDWNSTNQVFRCSILARSLVCQFMPLSQFLVRLKSFRYNIISLSLINSLHFIFLASRLVPGCCLSCVGLHYFELDSRYRRTLVHRNKLLRYFVVVVAFYRNVSFKTFLQLLVVDLVELCRVLLGYSCHNSCLILWASRMRQRCLWMVWWLVLVALFHKLSTLFKKVDLKVAGFLLQRVKVILKPLILQNKIPEVSILVLNNLRKLVEVSFFISKLFQNILWNSGLVGFG